MANINYTKPNKLEDFSAWCSKKYPLWCKSNFPFIENTFEALDTYGLICKIVQYLNEVKQNLNTTEENVQNIYDFVTNYFDNLDVQNEINNKLDEMASSGVLQEIISTYLNTKAVFGFNNVEEMKNAENLIEGSFAKTLGYYSINDGGSATYKIRNRTFDDIIDNGLIILMENESLVAELIVENEVNIKQFGAKGNGIDDDIVSIKNCLNKYKSIFIPVGIYNITESIELTDNYIIKCDGTINMVNNKPAIIIDGIKNQIDIKNITSLGNGIELRDTNKLNYGNELILQSIIAKGIGIYLYSTTNGIQYNNFNGNECIGNIDSIKIHTPSHGRYANENRFFNFQVKSVEGNGVNLLNEKNDGNSSVVGNRFINIGFEGVYNAITFVQSWYNSFIACRTEESISNDHVVFKKGCVGNIMEKDVTPFNRINIQEMVSGHSNIIKGVIYNNDTNYDLISDYIKISSSGFSYYPTRPVQINTFSLSGEIIELNGMVYNWILAKDNTIIKLGNSYCNIDMIGKPIVIVTGNPGTIVDVNDKVIIDSSETQYQGYKKIKVTLTGIDPTTKERFWSKELL